MVGVYLRRNYRTNSEHHLVAHGLILLGKPVLSMCAVAHMDSVARLPTIVTLHLSVEAVVVSTLQSPLAIAHCRL